MERDRLATQCLNRLIMKNLLPLSFTKAITLSINYILMPRSFVYLRQLFLITNRCNTEYSTCYMIYTPLLTIIDVIYTIDWYKLLNYDCKRCNFIKILLNCEQLTIATYYTFTNMFSLTAFFLNIGTGKTYRCSVEN